MDIVEFSERILGRKLSSYESVMVKIFSKIPKGYQIIMGRKESMLVKSSK